ncbi:choice-of-anchor M domain-containing protein [Rhizomonospora bruguierae]|uniref:choice-of-anchor M domain-containing protein n=1 Tax=Rhizomonospora bruguierae TaxID=1581705 RepID=UPI001BCB5A37|nr:choice-of-anchor M domain-containing protein [Micromonospora sp. NBRC 107566]
MRARTSTLTAVVAAMTAGMLAWGAPAQAGTVVLSRGHVDTVDVAFENGALEISVHDETADPDVERDPADVVFVVKPEAAVTVPNDPRYRFLGAPGATVHILPEVQDENLLWAGLATEELESGVFAGDSVQIRVTRVLGPGGFSLFTTGPTGAPTVLVNSEDGLPDAITRPVGSHMHLNWAFEKAGTYRIKVEVTGILATTGKRVTSAPAWLTFQVRC